MAYRNKLVLTTTMLISLFSSNLRAECKLDSLGEVWCSRYAMGDIKVDRLNILVCGKGECQQDRLGEFVCSKVEGGGAAMDDIGIVYCLGGCEPASVEYCERGQE